MVGVAAPAGPRTPRRFGRLPSLSLPTLRNGSRQAIWIMAVDRRLAALTRGREMAVALLRLVLDGKRRDKRTVERRPAGLIRREGRIAVLHAVDVVALRGVRRWVGVTSRIVFGQGNHNSAAAGLAAQGDRHDVHR